MVSIRTFYDKERATNLTGEFGLLSRELETCNEFIGNIIYRQFSVNLPFAAAYAMVPILIMVAYLVIVNRTGALDEL